MKNWIDPMKVRSAITSRRGYANETIGTALPSVLESRLKLYVGCLDENLTVFVPTGIDSCGVEVLKLFTIHYSLSTIH